MSVCAQCEQKTPYSDYLCRSCRLKSENDCCEYCGNERIDKASGRFRGLCTECKELARQTAPLNPEEVECLCPECGYAFPVDQESLWAKN